MPRIRTVKPELWTDSKVVALSLEARLLFIGSWNFADDYGCLTPDATQLKLRVLPTSDADPDALVAELFEAGLLEALRTSNGRPARVFWHVTNWSKHQVVNRPTPSEFGDPTSWTPAPTGGFTEDSRSAHGGLMKTPEDSLRTHGGMEGNGTEGNGKEHTTRARTREADAPDAGGVGSDSILPAQRALDLWEAVTGRRLTRTERASDTPKAREFLDATKADPDSDDMREFLEWAHTEGTWAVGGWSRAWARRPPKGKKRKPCSRCGDRGLLAEIGGELVTLAEAEESTEEWETMRRCPECTNGK